MLFFSQFNGLFRFIKMKIRRDFQSVFTSMFNAFSSCKEVQSVMGRDRIMEQSSRFQFHMANKLFFTQEKRQQQHSCPLFWLAFSHITNNRQPETFKLSYKHDIL